MKIVFADYSSMMLICLRFDMLYAFRYFCSALRLISENADVSMLPPCLAARHARHGAMLRDVSGSGK